MKKSKTVELPTGVMIGDKPKDLELTSIRSASRWKPIIDNLKNLDSTKTIQMSVNGASKSKIQGIKTSLKRFAKIINFNQRIKFAVKDDILHIWSN